MQTLVYKLQGQLTYKDITLIHFVIWLALEALEGGRTGQCKTMLSGWLDLSANICSSSRI